MMRGIATHRARRAIAAAVPQFEVGRISGETLTMKQPGDGWYVAVQWLGRVFMFETLRAGHG